MLHDHVFVPLLSQYTIILLIEQEEFYQGKLTVIIKHQFVGQPNFWMFEN